MEKIKEKFNNIIMPFINENGMEISFYDYIDNGFKAELTKGGKTLTSVAFSGVLSLIEITESQIDKMIAYYVSTTINSCKGN